jgi:hypothetical protein
MWCDRGYTTRLPASSVVTSCRQTPTSRVKLRISPMGTPLSSAGSPSMCHTAANKRAVSNAIDLDYGLISLLPTSFPKCDWLEGSGQTQRTGKPQRDLRPQHVGYLVLGAQDVAKSPLHCGTIVEQVRNGWDHPHLQTETSTQTIECCASTDKTDGIHHTNQQGQPTAVTEQHRTVQHRTVY